MTNPNAVSGKEKYYLGVLDGERVWIGKPTFDCGWYWGFGYIGNRNTHTHLDSILNESKKNWFDAFRGVFSDIHPALENDSNLWKFVETMRTLYTLKDASSIYHIGGSHYTTPLFDLKNKEMYETIVCEQMPALFEEIVKILESEY